MTDEQIERLLVALESIAESLEMTRPIQRRLRPERSLPAIRAMIEEIVEEKERGKK